MKEGNNGVVAADDKAALPKEGVVTPAFAASGETAVGPAAPNKGDTGNDGAVVKEEETEDNTPKEGEGEEAADDPNPKRGGDETPPMLGFVKEEVAGAAADMEDGMFVGMSDPWMAGKEGWVLDKELLKENDGAGPEEKLKVDMGEEELEVTVDVAGVDIGLKEYEKGLVVDEVANKLLLAAMDELGFDEKFNRGDEELKGKVVEEGEEPIGMTSEVDVAAEPKEKDGVWSADAAMAVEDKKIGEVAEEKNGEDDNAEEPEEREKENPEDWEDDEEEVAEGLKEKGDAIQIRDGLLPLSTVSSFPTTVGEWPFSLKCSFYC